MRWRFVNGQRWEEYMHRVHYLFVKVHILSERGICPVNLEIYSVSKAKYNVRYKKRVMIIYYLKVHYVKCLKEEKLCVY